MDAIKYFLFNSGLLILIVAILAFLLGWLFSKVLGGSSAKEGSLQCKCGCCADDGECRCEEKTTKLKEQLEDCRKNCAVLEAKLEGDDYDDEVEFRQKSLGFFSQSLKSGKIKEDKELGYLYTERPDDVDDLTEIKGVGEVLQEKLNDFGIYTYRQIALWNEDTLKRFSDKLEHFKERMLWDNWSGQARRLHRKKYSEKL